MTWTDIEELAMKGMHAVIEEGGLQPTGADVSAWSDSRQKFVSAVGQRGREGALAAGLSQEEANRVQIRAGQLAQGLWAEQNPRPAEQNESAQPSQQVEPSRGPRRVNVNFSEQAYELLERMARQTGKSMSDVLRDAIALKAWFEQTRAEGAHILVERPDGKIREVISV